MYMYPQVIIPETCTRKYNVIYADYYTVVRWRDESNDSVALKASPTS